MPRAALVRDVFLQRTGAVDDGDSREVVRLRRRGGRPLERVSLPRVVAGGPSVAQNDAVEEVEEEDCDRDADGVGTDRRDEVQAGPFGRLGIVEGTARHPIQTELM